jgi:hypothetical protein
VAAALWILSELMEIVNQGFSPLQLGLTITAFVLLPLGVLGIHSIQSEGAGALSLAGAVSIAIAFIVWSGVSIVDLVLGSGTEMDILRTGLAETILWWAGHVFTSAGLLLFGMATVRCKLPPRWPGGVLIAAAAPTCSSTH